MSTEEDIATIEAVTASIAGPLKVWVLRIESDSSKYLYLHYTFEGVLTDLRHDLESSYTTPPAQPEIDKLVKWFEGHHEIMFRDTVYSAGRQEVLE